MKTFYSFEKTLVSLQEPDLLVAGKSHSDKKSREGVIVGSYGNKNFLKR